MPASADPRYLQPHKQSFSQQTPAMADLDQVRSRERSYPNQDDYASDSSRYSKQRKPINEAINSAFTTQSSNTAALPPEVLQALTSQITANVMQQLKTSTLPQSPARSGNPPTDAGSSSGASPRFERAQVYTPPSPYRAAEESQNQTSPSRSTVSTRASQEQTSPPLEQRAMSPHSQGSNTDEVERSQDNFRRPPPLQRLSTGGDMTTIEKIWGSLFDKAGEATPRLGQFLRGIAIHLIEDYEPKQSLVVTPQKMQKYYEETKLLSEIYPWNVIYDDRTSSISRMLREVECQHHLVQEKLNERPDLPGLTPQGFETWATMLIKAHPDQEYERLSKTIFDMPINNADNRKERLPKEISRRMFPKDSDMAIVNKLQSAMTVHCNVKFPPRQDSTASITGSQHAAATDSTSQPSLSKVSSGRDEPTITPVTSRADHPLPTSNTYQPPAVSDPTPASVIESEDDVPTPQPIERERKPYVAQAGAGKTYDLEDETTADVRPAATEPKLGRSMSSTSRNGDYVKPRPTPITVHHNADTRAPLPGSAPIDIPASRHHRTNSSYHKDPIRRTRSPSMNKETGYGRQTDPNLRTQSYASGAGSYSAGGIGETPDTERRYREYETNRERHAGDRFDAARMAAYDPRDRDRERESRPRGQSVAFDDRGEPIKGRSYTTEDDYYRSAGGYPPPSHHQPRDAYPSSYAQPTAPHYPPSSFREVR